MQLICLVDMGHTLVNPIGRQSNEFWCTWKAQSIEAMYNKSKRNIILKDIVTLSGPYTLTTANLRPAMSLYANRAQFQGQQKTVALSSTIVEFMSLTAAILKS